MSVDIFEFWSHVGPTDKYHPKDRDVLSRMKKTHLFDLRCLPHCFLGPLKTAPVVLLYLSPGLDDEDVRDARSYAGRNRYVKCRLGEQPLPGPDEHRKAWEWWTSRTRCFGIEDWKQLSSKVSVLNIGAYHSKKGPNDQILAALPSSRVSLDWAQTVLFPQAIAGDKVVICLRAAHFWGLDEGKNGKRYGKSLFAPRVQRGGHMLDKRLKATVIKAVQTILARG